MQYANIATAMGSDLPSVNVHEEQDTAPRLAQLAEPVFVQPLNNLRDLVTELCLGAAGKWQKQCQKTYRTAMLAYCPGTLPWKSFLEIFLRPMQT